MAEALSTLNALWPVLGILWTLFTGWAYWHLARRFPARSEHEAVAGRVSALERGSATQAEHEAIAARVETLEKRIATLPDADTLLNIRLALTELRGDFKGINARMDGIGTELSALKNNMDMLIEYHIKKDA